MVATTRVTVPSKNAGKFSGQVIDKILGRHVMFGRFVSQYEVVCD